jgi:hypothetical protein
VAAYFIVSLQDGSRRLLKGEPFRGRVIVVANHLIGDGGCDCQGFKYRNDCRHVEMLAGRGQPVDRRTARVAIADFVRLWESILSPLFLEGYEFVDADERLVRKVRMRSRRPPLRVGDFSFSSFLVVHRGALMEILISR